MAKSEPEILFSLDPSLIKTLGGGDSRNDKLSACKHTRGH
jgi:hypothetical protein